MTTVPSVVMAVARGRTHEAKREGLVGIRIGEDIVRYVCVPDASVEG